MAGLRLELDPSGIVTGSRQAESALERVTREAGQTEAALTRAGTQGGAAASGLGQQVGRMGSAFNAARPQIQQAAFQIGDFATQVGAGTSASVALAQQLPQLLGGFGALGAVAGAAVAILVPLGSAMLGGSDAAETFADKVDTLNGSLRELRDINDIYSLDGINALIERYGELNAQILLLVSRQREFNIDRTMQDARDAVSALREELSGGFFQSSGADIAAAFGIEGFSDLRAYTEEARAAQAAVNEIRAALEAVSSASTFEEQADAVARLSDLIEGTAMEGSAFAGTLLDAEAALRALNAEGAATGGWLGSAIDGAAGLAAQLWNAAQAALNIRAAQSEPTAPGRPRSRPNSFIDAGYDPPEAPGRPRTRPGSFIDAGVPIVSRGGRGGRGGGGGGKSAAETAAEDFDRLLASLDPLVRAQQQFEEAQKTINAALETGGATAEEAASAYQLAQERFDEASQAARETSGLWSEIIDIGGSAIDRLIAGTADWRDVLKETVLQLIQAYTKARLLKSVQGGEAGDSLGTLIFKGLTGGFAGFFDGGGRIGQGMTGLVGEYGPELVRATSSGALVTSRADTARSGGTVAPVFHIDARGAQKGVAEEIEAAMRRYASVITGQAVAQVRGNLATWNQQFATDGVLA